MLRRAVALTVMTTALACAPAAVAAAPPTALADPASTPITGLPGAAGDEPDAPVAADGGVAVVVTNGDANRMELYGGRLGQPVRRLARCGVRTFEEFEVRAPVVSGDTVAWASCPEDRDPYPSPVASITVYDPSGTRVVPTATVFPQYALAGRTLAVAEDRALHLVDLDTGAERTLAIPGRGPVVRIAGQRDGTVAMTRSRPDTEGSSDCGEIVASVLRPGAASPATIPAVDCSRAIAIGSDRIAFLRDTKDFPDLVVAGLDGSGAQRVDGNLDGDDSFATDGSALSWIHHDCAGTRKVSAPLTALPADIKASCPVRVRSARLTSKGRLAVAVACPNGCRTATVSVGPTLGRRVGLRRAGRRTLLLRLTARDRRTLRRTGKLELATGSRMQNPVFPYRTVTVRVRRP